MCQNRLKNMKDTYFSNKRKVTASKNKYSGAGAGHVYKPKWPLFQNLQFLDKTGEKCDSISNVTCEVGEGPAGVAAVSEPPVSLTPRQTDMLQAGSHDVTYFDDTLGRYVTITVDGTEQNLDKVDEAVETLQADLLDEEMQDCEEQAGHNAGTGVKRSTGQAFFEKKGSKRKQNKHVMEEAVSVLKDLCKTVVSESEADPFASFVASCLRALPAEKRKQCEDDILRALMAY